MQDDQSELYKIVTLKNLDDEDFVFQVDKVPYLVKAGEVRNFPKFMARIAVKHLVDKILEKEDHEGKLMANPQAREELAARIVVSEENYEVPQAPTTDDIIERMNRPSDIDAALERNKARLKAHEPAVIPEPQPDMSTVGAAVPPVASQTAVGVPTPNVPVVVPSEPGVPSPALVKDTGAGVPVQTAATPTVVPVEAPQPAKTASDASTVAAEEFEGLKPPTRDEMLAYAKNTLKLDIEDKKTKAAFDKMTDEELYKELQMGV